MGDVFDIRKNIDFWSLNWAKKNIFKPLEEMGITCDLLVGNHDSFYKNTLEINSLECLLLEFANLRVFSKPSEVTLDKTKLMYVPWICQDNEQQTLNLIQDTEAKVVLGHLELKGFAANPGWTCEHGYDASIFDKFELVMSGHFHTRSKKSNVQYVGNSYQMYWNDYNDKRGFNIFDTDTQKLKFYENPYEMFHKIFYDDTKNEYYDVDFEQYRDTCIKLIVENKTDYTQFDHVITNLQDVVIDLKVIEDFSVEGEENDDMELEHEDTLTILERYIDEMNTNIDSKKIKEIMKSLYVEALEVV
jgi:DNA repair exonuclease SbcCD nuclease subunit